MNPRRIHPVPLVACLCAVLASSSPAAAQAVGAEVLYQRGRTLLKQGDVPAACQAFADSLRLEEAVGTMLNLADCREREGKLASAWSTFLGAASLASRTGARPHAAEARRRAERVAPRLSYLTISVADGARVEGLALTHNGEAVDASLWNQGIPVDGGTHTVVATAVGNQPVSIEVEVAAERERATAEIPRLKRIEDFAVPPPVGPPPRAVEERVEVTPVTTAPPPPPLRPRRMSALRWTAVAVATAGAGGLATGALFGLRANDAAARSRATCPTDPCTDAAALALSARSGRDATRANLALAAGGVLLAGGVVLWVAGAPRVAPAVGPDEVALVVTGRF